MSAIGADAKSRSDYGRTKAEGEAAVFEALPDAIVFRPSIMFGPEDGFFNRFAAMARLSPALPMIGGGDTKFQPVYVGDVAEAFARAVDGQVAGGKVYELGGPEALSFRDCMKLMLQGHRPQAAVRADPVEDRRTAGRDPRRACRSRC